MPWVKIPKQIAMVFHVIGFFKVNKKMISDIYHFNLNSSLNDRNHNAFTMLSRREGTTTESLNSYHDIVHFITYVKVFDSVRKELICPWKTHLITLKYTSTTTI